MNFRSDNEAPVAEPIMRAILDANTGYADAYGGDDWSKRLNQAFSKLFEREVAVLPLVNGTAANALACAQLTQCFGAILCHSEAHLAVDECGAAEFYTGGAKLLPIEGDNGKLAPDALSQRIETLGLKGEHDPLPQLISITQATECGTLYSPEEIAEIGHLTQRHNLNLHMDGARFANAVATLNCRPADITWKAGVDLLSFGATKNGAMAAEALIMFNPDRFKGLLHRRMKAGHLLSKMRYVSCQLLAYLEDDLWLTLASQANQAASRIATAIDRHPQASLIYPVQANELFVRLGESLHRQLIDAGFRYHPWPGQPGLFRFVVPYDVEQSTISAFESALAS